MAEMGNSSPKGGTEILPLVHEPPLCEQKNNVITGNMDFLYGLQNVCYGVWYSASEGLSHNFGVGNLVLLFEAGL